MTMGCQGLLIRALEAPVVFPGVLHVGCVGCDSYPKFLFGCKGSRKEDSGHRLSEFFEDVFLNSIIDVSTV